MFIFSRAARVMLADKRAHQNVVASGAVMIS